MLLIGPKGKLDHGREHRYFDELNCMTLPKSRELLEPELSIVGHKDVCDHFPQSSSIFYSATIIAEFRVLRNVSIPKDMLCKTCELGVAHLIKRNSMEFHSEKSYLLVISSPDHDEPVSALEYLIGSNGWMRGAMSRGFLTCNQVVARDVSQTGNLRKPSTSAGTFM